MTDNNREHPMIEYYKRIINEYDSDRVAEGLRHFLEEAKKYRDRTDDEDEF